MSVTAVYDVTKIEVQQYTDQVKRTSGLFSLIQESFDFDFGEYRGVTEADLATISRRISDQQLKDVISEIALVGDGPAKSSDKSVVNGKGYKKAFFAAKKRSDGKYDVVYCTATQIRTIDWEAIGWATLVAGGIATGVAVALPGVGVVAGAAIVGGTAAATAATGGIVGALQKKFKKMPNVIMGYIGQELTNKNLMQIVN
jgi:hypothetical protein